MIDVSLQPFIPEAGTRTPEAWRSSRTRYQDALRPWADDRVRRAAIDKKHPVYDFLFTYYSYRPAYLLRWSPGADVELLGAEESELDWPLDYIKTPSGFIIPSSSFPRHRVQYLDWAVKYLKGVSARPPTFGCLGLHEWAMLYHAEEPRHGSVSLRVSPKQIIELIESRELKCSHYDAYRFFTPQALPRNQAPLTRESTPEHDQPGCIHVTMDLYRFAHKISPWCPAELVADSFLLAVAAREVDMRASPYNLLEFGLSPICIETAEGRAHYIREQQTLRERAVPIRQRLIDVYQKLLTSC